MENFETLIRKIVTEELAKRAQDVELISVPEFCRKHDISRTTLWRAEKEGRVKVMRIGKRIFLNPNQFVG